MAATLQATFSKDKKELDGLGAISDDLVADPLTRRVIIGIVEVTHIDTDILNGGIKTPRVRLVNVEVMGIDGGDADTAREMMGAAYTERTGQTAPPPTLFDAGVPGGDDDGFRGEPEGQGKALAVPEATVLRPEFAAPPEQDDDGDDDGWTDPAPPQKRARR